MYLNYTLIRGQIFVDETGYVTIYNKNYQTLPDENGPFVSNMS